MSKRRIEGPADDPQWIEHDKEVARIRADGPGSKGYTPDQEAVFQKFAVSDAASS